MVDLIVETKKAPKRLICIYLLAEEEGFEPSVDLHLRLISSQVHSTTLPSLRSWCMDFNAPNIMIYELRADQWQFSGLALLQRDQPRRSDLPFACKNSRQISPQVHSREG
jgi:hypothetical protein